MSSTIKPRFGRSLPAGVFALGLALGIGMAGNLQAVELSACMEDRCGPQICTANDVNLVLVGLGVQDDGCVGPGDTVDMWLRSIANTTTGQTRYDVSMWFAVDGDPNDDGARSGQCAVEILTPAATIQAGAPACYAEPDNGGVEFNCGSGPFLNADGDGCGDITKGNNLPDCGREVDVTKPSDGFTCHQPDGIGDATVMDFQDTIRFPCTDSYDPVSSPPDGFVDLPYCVTWHNQSDSSDCNFPGTPICPSQVSKCTCETGAGAATNVPAPNLGLSCSCSPSLSTAPTPVTCTVTYTNPDTTPACNYDGNTVERFRCGTAAHVRFDADYDEANGLLSNFSTIGTGGGGTTAIEPGVDPVFSQVIRWTPDSREGTPAIIGPGDTASLSFTYTPYEGVSGQMVIPVRTYWSDDDGFGSNVLQAAAATTCTFDLDPTWAMVTDVRAERSADGVAVIWETGAEAATLGFHVERWSPSAAAWLRVNEHLLPAVRHVPGGHYRLVDSHASDAGSLKYRIIEVEATGGSRTHGPYDVSVARGTLRSESASAFVAGTKGPSARILDHAAAGAKTAGIDPAESSGMAKILVREAGLYSVDAADLATALDMSFRQVEKLIVKGQLRLSAAGSPVAWTPSNDRSKVLFYGEAPAGNLSPESVYWIERGPGLLMKTESLSRPYSEPPPDPQTFTDTVLFEKDLFPMVSVAADPLADFWTWEGLIAGHPTYGSVSFEVEVDGVADTTSDGVMTLQLWGLAGEPGSPNHRARVTLNGVVIGDEAWDGQGDRSVEIATGQSLLEEGPNVVGVEAILGNFFIDSIGRYDRVSRAVDNRLVVPPGDNEVVGVSGFTTPQISVYELSNPRLPVRVALGSVTTGASGDYVATFRRSSEGAPYLVVGDPAIRSDAAVVVDAASTLRAPDNRGEYVVIAPRELADAAALLADYRMSRGLEARVVLLDDIMDEFNHGASSPLAIKSFLAHAYRHWAVPPRYVALAGKGSFDYNDHLGLGGNLIPPMLVPSAGGLVSADLRLGDVTGDDGIPEIAVGRIPVLDPVELEGYIDKIIAYEADPGGDWRDRVLMVADNPDFAGDFPADSDALAAILPDDAAVERVYLYQPYSAGEARDRILAAVNDGAAVLNFVGHGGSDQLAAERMLDLDDVALMFNQERLPVVTAFTCYLAIFDYPGYISLGEELVVHADGGAAAVWGPTGLSGNLRAVELGEHAMAALFGPEEKLGDAVIETMRAFVDGGGNVGHVDVYSLLGDPALERSRDRQLARRVGE